MRGWKRAAVALLCVGAVTAATWYGLRQIPASFVYGCCFDFESLPENDDALKVWWQAQLGVASTVVERHGKWVGVIWIQVQTAGGREPPVPDFRAAFERLGYRGLKHIHYDWRGSGKWPEPVR